MLTLALSKGRILEDTAGLLAQCGIRLDSSAVDSRQLILPTDDPGLRLLIVLVLLLDRLHLRSELLHLDGRTLLVQHRLKQEDTDGDHKQNNGQHP